VKQKRENFTTKLLLLMHDKTIKSTGSQRA